MAKDQVSWKKGLSSDLPQERNPGTILVATDTGDMYIDDTSSIRIQIKDSTKLPLSGGTMTGNIDIDNHKIVNVPTPSDDSDAVPKGFVDTAFTTLESEMAESLKGYLPLKGGTMTGSIDMGNQLIKNVETPVESSDAVNKSYVDTYKLRTVDTAVEVSTGTAMINFLDSSSIDISNYIGSVTFPMITFSDPGNISFNIDFFGIDIDSAKYVLVAYSGPISFSAGGNHSGGFQVLYHYITPSSNDNISFNISVDSSQTSGVCYPVIFIFKANYQE